MILKGKKVVLRPIKMSDAPRFVKWFNDPEVGKFVSTRVKDLKEEISYINNLKKDKAQHHFCIDTNGGIHIGSLALREVSKNNRSADLGIIIGDKSHWSKGYGSDAMAIVINFGFKKLKLHRIYLDVFSYNERAIKMYTKLGFKHEGNFRESYFWNGKFWDTYHMSILKREWKGINKK
jgi:RimJ/RimL family protein N-acetyltransferase